MPILDTPITTDDRNIDKILAQHPPVILIFHNDDVDKPLADALDKAAKKHAGDLLVVRLHVSDSRDNFVRYGEPPTPALVVLTAKAAGRKVKSDAEQIRPSDLRAHIAHLLTDKPLPQKKKNATAPTSDKPVPVTDKSFRKDVLKSKKPVLVDFWADWCGPCKMIAPHVDELAKAYGDKIKFAKLDVDRNPIMSQRYQVRSIPTFILFEGGQPAQTITGANPVAIRKLVQRYSR